MVSAFEMMGGVGQIVMLSVTQLAWLAVFRGLITASRVKKEQSSLVEFLVLAYVVMDGSVLQKVAAPVIQTVGSDLNSEINFVQDALLVPVCPTDQQMELVHVTT